MRTSWRTGRKLAIVLAICAALGACGGAEPASLADPHTATPRETATPRPTPTSAPTPVPTPIPTPVPTPDLTGLALNRLTGEYINEEIAARRPVAVVINNLIKALPQSGIGQASMYHEVLAEGNITRIIAVFQDFDAAKIGPIRSMRHYFLDFALDHDAIFAHHGRSPQGLSALKNLNIDNIEGLNVDGTYYFRDPARYSIPGMKEHSSYTSAENLWKYINDKAKYRTERAADYTGLFQFYEEPTAPAGGEAAANKVTVLYAGSFAPFFTYDPETRLYAREEYGEPQIDALTGEQLTVTNVIVQNAKVNFIPGDTEGRRDVLLVAGGTGTLFTNGVAVPVSWSKSSHAAPTVWLDAEGNPLTLNVGKTWVCVTANAPTFE